MFEEIHHKAAEVYGQTMMGWGRAEFGIQRVILVFSTNEKIRRQLENPQKNAPNTWELIEELRECAREAYERFILDFREELEELEKANLEDSGEYSQKGFDEFIKALHSARESRNSLVHDVAQKEMGHFAEARGESSQGDIFLKVAQGIFDDTAACMLSVSKVAPPMCLFLVWAQLIENQRKADKA